MNRINISEITRHFAKRHVAHYFGRPEHEYMYRERKGRMIVADLKAHQMSKDEARDFLNKQYGKTWEALANDARN